MGIEEKNCYSLRWLQDILYLLLLHLKRTFPLQAPSPWRKGRAALKASQLTQVSLVLCQHSPEAVAQTVCPCRRPSFACIQWCIQCPAMVRYRLGSVLGRQAASSHLHENNTWPSRREKEVHSFNLNTEHKYFSGQTFWTLVIASLSKSQALPLFSNPHLLS